MIYFLCIMFHLFIICFSFLGKSTVDNEIVSLFVVEHLDLVPELKTDFLLLRVWKMKTR